MDGGKQAQFRVGEWHVDPAGGQITRDGKAIRVEPRVMDVLVYLAGKPGQVVTREEAGGERLARQGDQLRCIDRHGEEIAQRLRR